MPIRDTLRHLFRSVAGASPEQPEPPAAPEKLGPGPPTPPKFATRPVYTNPPSPSPTPAARPLAPAAGPVLALYKYDACPFCRRVQQTIDRLGISDRIELRDTRRERKWRADLVEKTGRTQVPCLFIDGEPMFESADISAWLTEQYG